MRRSNEEIFEIDAVLGLPRGVVEKPDRHTDDVSINLNEVTEGGGMVAEKGGGERFDCGFDGIEFAFVFRKVSYEGEDCPAVSDVGSSNVHHSTLGTRAPMLENWD
jgi:hypothetical protein